MKVRSALELADVADPAWPLIRSWIDASAAPVRVIEADTRDRTSVLHRLQVTASSVLGALAFNCGGLVADHGWFKILGGGGHGLPDLATANGLQVNPELMEAAPGSLLVAYDALGGRFAIDGGSLGIAPGEVCYFGPDSLSWSGLGGGHGAFVQAALTGGLAETFAPLRWPGWQRETETLNPDSGLSLYPPPFSREGKKIAGVSRRPVPLWELHSFYDDAAAQLDGMP